MSASGTKLSDILSPFFSATAQKPGFFPRAMTGPLPGALMWTLLGAGAGRYLGAPLLRSLNPWMSEQRSNKLGKRLGALAGLIPGAYLAYRAVDSGGPRALFNGLQNLPPEPKTASVSSQEKRANLDWITPSIPFGAARHTLAVAERAGTLQPYEAGNLAQIMAEAKRPGSNWISPSAVARSAASFGIGSLMGTLVGAGAKTLFSDFTPAQQKSMAKGFGIGNMILDSMGRATGT